MTRVKGESKRAEKARATRQRMLAAARELLIEQGYGATAMQDIADRAGVAVQTLYFTFGNKRSLLKELVDVSIAGDQEPVATMDRPWFRDVLATGTAAAQLRAHVHGSRQVLDRVAESPRYCAPPRRPTPRSPNFGPKAPTRDSPSCPPLRKPLWPSREPARDCPLSRRRRAVRPDQSGALPAAGPRSRLDARPVGTVDLRHSALSTLHRLTNP